MSLNLLFLVLVSVLVAVRGGVVPNTEQAESAQQPVQEVTPLKVYHPTELFQLCKENANYCICVDQVRPGIVHASQVNATDAHGCFLFERSRYADSPFRVCFGGCCILLDFSRQPGCVQMSYVSRASTEPGHLLARFADDVETIIGPRRDMYKSLMTCTRKQQGGQSLPYAVIGARSGGKKKQQAKDSHGGSAKHLEPGQDQNQLSKDQKSGSPDASRTQSTGAQPDSAAQTAQVGAQPTTNHDYFDDVTVPSLYT